jgi:hypothetical protein
MPTVLGLLVSEALRAGNAEGLRTNGVEGLQKSTRLTVLELEASRARDTCALARLDVSKVSAETRGGQELRGVDELRCRESFGALGVEVLRGRRFQRSTC